MISPDEIRGLSLWEPWASLVALGFKGCETRSRPMSWRGVLAIHSTRRVPDEVFALAAREGPFRDVLLEAGLADPSAWTFGKILAVTTVRECITSEMARVDLSIPTRELAVGNYGRGRHVLRLGTVERLREPIPYRGKQGLFFLDAHTIAEIRRRSRKLPEVV